ncbi:hypothetical protein MAM1_0128c06065 [Mucor ambiguus]|uniref:Uncharacterized protein n=1 Tax=Mucor ambiguus TaxID=91626 RepID=A0A0C9MGY2_9FUNG|nr:hypothetical protein MAM1_0128c06065 [Mucor ambiguus]
MLDGLAELEAEVREAVAVDVLAVAVDVLAMVTEDVLALVQLEVRTVNVAVLAAAALGGEATGERINGGVAGAVKVDGHADGAAGYVGRAGVLSRVLASVF